jgi:hypothetical protein
MMKASIAIIYWTPKYMTDEITCGKVTVVPISQSGSNLKLRELR